MLQNEAINLNEVKLVFITRFWLNSRADNTVSVIPPEAVSIKGPYILPRKVYKEKFLLSYK